MLGNPLVHKKIKPAPKLFCKLNQGIHRSIFLTIIPMRVVEGLEPFFLANTEQEVEYTPSRIL